MVTLSKRISKIERLIEKKTFDHSLQHLESANGKMYYLQQIEVGAGDGQRIGKRITVNSIQLNMHFARNGLATVSDSIRIILFRDRQNKAELPLSADLLEEDIAMSLRNKANYSRFDIIRDKVIIFQRAEDGTAVPHRLIKWFIPLKGNKSTWEWLDSVTGTVNVDKSGKNTLYMFILGLQTTATERTVVTIRMRTRYMDA